MIMKGTGLSSSFENRSSLLFFSAPNGKIRFGVDNRFRVFYRVDNDQKQVVILAIGEKVGNRLFIGGEEVEI